MNYDGATRAGEGSADVLDMAIRALRKLPPDAATYLFPGLPDCPATSNAPECLPQLAIPRPLELKIKGDSKESELLT